MTDQPIESLSGSDLAAFQAAMRNYGIQVSEEAALTANQLNHLYSSPVQLVAAPGAGKVALPIDALLVYNKGTHGYYTGPNADHPRIAIGSRYMSADTNGSILLNLDTLTSSVSRVKFSTPTLLSNGHGIDLADLVNQPILLGNDLFDLIGYGEVTASSIISGGSGYAVNDTGGFNENNTAGTYTVTGVDGGGAVTSYTLGTGDEVVNGASVNQTLTTWVNTGAGDSAFSINVDAIAPGNGTAKAIVTYQIITVT